MAIAPCVCNRRCAREDQMSSPRVSECFRCAVIIEEIGDFLHLPIQCRHFSNEFAFAVVEGCAEDGLGFVRRFRLIEVFP